MRVVPAASGASAIAAALLPLPLLLLAAACQLPPDSGGPEDPLFECGGTDTDDPKLLESMAFVRGYLADKDVPGAAFAIVHNGQIQVAVAGSKDANRCEPVTPNTRFFTFLSQHLTAAAVHAAIAEGDLALTDAFVDYAPEFSAAPPTAGDPADVTIDHLLSNTSGLSVSASSSCLDKATWLEAFDELPLWAPGGRIHQRQPINMSLAALALERATGTTYREALRTRVLDPLGMAGTFNRLDALKGDMATGFQEGNDGLLSVPVSLRECEVPDAYLGYLVSATDAGAFVRFLLEPNNPLLVDSGEAFFAPERVTRGHFIRGPLDDGSEWVFANLRSSGYGYDVRVVPEHDFGVVVLLNGVHGDPEDIAAALVRIYTGARAAHNTQPQALSSYAGLPGTYRDLAGAVLEIARDGDDLTVQLDGGTVFPLVPAQRGFDFVTDLFEFERSEDDAHQLRFWRDDSGEADIISENAGRSSLGTPFYRVE